MWNGRRAQHLVGAGILGLAGSMATGATSRNVFFDDFSGESDGAAPTSGATTWFTSGSDPTALARVAGAVGNAGPSLRLNDSNASTGAVAELNFGVPSFGTFDTGLPGQDQSVLKISFDFRVDSFASSNNSGSTLRVAIKDGNNGAGNRFFVLGFGQALLNDGGATGSDLFLYAGGASAFNLSSVGEANAIGLIPGTGWEEGFNFGQVETAEDSDTNDEFYRIELSFTGGDANVLVIATQLDANGALTDNTVSKVVTLANVLALSNTGTDGIGFYTGNSGQGVMFVDNLSFDISSVPEPGSLGMMGLAGMALLARRRKR